MFVSELLGQGGEDGVEQHNRRRGWVCDCRFEPFWMLFDLINKTTKSSPVNLQPPTNFIASRCQLCERQTVLTRQRLYDQDASRSVNQATEHGERRITLPVFDARDR